MFVTKAKYNSVLVEMLAYRAIALEKTRKLNAQIKEWNALVDRVNKGELVPRGHIPSGQFTAEEIDTLVRLCHPDKHGGSKAANDITARLLALRNSKGD